MAATVCVGIYKKALPAYLTVYSLRGRLLFYRLVGGNEQRVLLYIPCEAVAVSVRPLSGKYMTQTKYIKARPSICMRLYFSPTEKSPALYIKEFYLSDATYGLPVVKATLYLKGK